MLMIGLALAAGAGAFWKVKKDKEEKVKAEASKKKTLALRSASSSSKGILSTAVNKPAAKKALTNQQLEIFHRAMKTLTDEKKLKELADSYKKQGFGNEANMLMKKAALRKLPDAQKKARREAYRKAMKSKDKLGVLKLASEFEKAGAWGAADSLKKYSLGL